MDDNRYKKLGSEKRQEFDKNFDQMYDKYEKKAKELGLATELKFVKEHGKVLIYAVL